MQTAIERLRASKAKTSARDGEWGKPAGIAAAKDELDYEQLIEISKIDRRVVDEDNAHHWLKDAADPDREQSETQFNEMLFGEKTVSPAFILGFIEGAQDFYKEVKDQL